ncbi:toxin-antitoxin system HicB family antitoxin [Geobacter sulfurreducens]|uniref:toxin-antitoxin system HicB family antitoxin n=1 Tax=Geobacter sulfurreducens TaxID=35554 RepID=UPI0009E2CF1C|nr:toxin-antitoxin system HicB family antitoxin [Geobacter sulfurreducens]QVW34415.1 toxin-antitoxin system HicB family antitoxin [Geobacter sulfurreducens]
MKKTVEEYMALPYTVEITPDDDSYFVKIKELEGCMSVGESKADALLMIDDAMRDWLTVALEEDIDIPLPESLQAERYSGKFPLRIPKSLHRKLAEGAEADRVSLNQYLVMLLSERHSIHQVKKILAEVEDQPCEEPEVEPVITYTGESRKVLPFHRTYLKVVGE